MATTYASRPAITREVLAIAALRLKYRHAAAQQATKEYDAPTLRGDALKLWASQDQELVLSGPSETGKTWASLHKLNMLMLKYPGAQAAIVRKTYQSMHGSVLQTYRRILGKDTLVHSFGGEKPEWFDYPNGSRVFVGGMDNPQKVLSSERDIIYVNQAEELSLDDWETLTTRVTGRGKVMPYTQIYGDCNPSHSRHWILEREPLRMLYSRHEDNPTLFDDGGVITEQGIRTLAVLDGLTGTRKDRLLYGRWVSAEGAVYADWDASLHMIDPFPIPPEWAKYRVIDFGFVNPFVCQWWAEDSDGRLYRYRELYQTNLLTHDAADEINRLSEGEQYQWTAADHDASERATLHSKGIHSRGARKDVQGGIQAVQERLPKQADGKPRISLMRGALVRRDPQLVEKKLPTCTEEEIDGYVWAKGNSGQAAKEVPVKENDHGLDAMRYMVYTKGKGKGVYV